MRRTAYRIRSPFPLARTNSSFISHFIPLTDAARARLVSPFATGLNERQLGGFHEGEHEESRAREGPAGQGQSQGNRRPDAEESEARRRRPRRSGIRQGTGNRGPYPEKAGGLMARARWLASGLTAAVLLAGCARNPATGKNELMLVSESQEIQMGTAYDKEVVASIGLYPDPALQTYIQNL